MGHKHSREEILAAALAAALEDGLSRLTFGRLAARMGISDRTVVYYFPTKDALVASVLLALGEQLQDLLTTALTHAVPDHVALVAAAWPALARPEVDQLFGLYFEAIGQAAAGLQPYRSLAGGLVEGWLDWLVGLLSARDARAEAVAALALLDGLLLVRQLAGPAVADLAATRLLAR